MGIADFPLPLRWRATAEESCWVCDGPLAFGELLVARCGDWMVGLDRLTGAPRWRSALARGAGDGELLLAAGNLAVADYRRNREDASVAGFDAAGDARWRVDLRGSVIRGGAAMVGNRLCLASGPSGGPYELFVVDLGDGVVRARSRLVHGGALLAALDGRLLVGVPMPASGHPGLYTVDMEGGSPTAVDDADVWYLGRNRSVVVSCGARAGEDHTLTARDADSLAQRWTTPCRGGIAAIDDEVVAHAELAGDAPVPVLRDAAGGEVRWRGQPLPAEPTSFMLVGPLLMVLHRRGVALYRRSDGAFLGDAFGIGWAFTATADGDDLFYGCDDIAMCADLSAVQKRTA